MIKIEENKLSLPCYVYNIDQLHNNIRAFKDILGEEVRILYATMANPRKEILRELPNFNIGVFVNSLSHLQNAIESGIPYQNINFAGSGHDLKTINKITNFPMLYCADSINQLKLLNRNTKLKVGIRINVGSLFKNDFDPAPRLGINVEDLPKAISINPNISILHVYLGTNLEKGDYYKKALTELIHLSKKIPQIDTIDLGGGLAFSPNERKFISDIIFEIKDTWNLYNTSGLKLIIEPGRALVRSMAKLYVKVNDVKYRYNKQFIIVNTSGTWYPRKIIHNANDHFISLYNKTKQLENNYETVIVGNTTFSKDFLAELNFPKVNIGDIIMFDLAGAYCESMHLDFLGIDSPNIYFYKKGKLVAK